MHGSRARKGGRGALWPGLALLAFLVSGCVQQPLEPLRIATNVWPGYEPLYLARSLEMYPPGTVHLVEMSNATDVTRVFRDRLVDMAALTLDEVLTLAQVEPDVRVVLVMDVSHGADALMAREDIRSLPDLAGRRIGVEHTAVGAYFLARTLEAAGLQASEVTVIPVTEGGHEKAWVSGEVDAVVTFEPTRTRLLREGAHVLYDSSRFPGEIVDVLAVHEDLLRQRPADVQRVRRVWFAALHQMQAAPLDSAVRMAPRLGLTAPDLQAALAGLRYPDRAENDHMLSGGLLPTAERLTQVMLQDKLLTRRPDLAPLFVKP